MMFRPPFLSTRPMHRQSPSNIFAGMLMLGLMAGSQAQEVDSRWRLRVHDLKHQVKVDATIRFSAGAATESRAPTSGSGPAN